MKPGEEEAMLLALACFAADITSGELERMTPDARHWLMERLGLSAEQFNVACLYVADCRKKYRDGLKALRLENFSAAMLNPPPAAARQTTRR